MPTYEYRCPACGEEFERFQRMSDEPRAECPACGADAQRKLSAGAGLLFKGSGFYITDYARGESYKKAADAEKGGSGGAKKEGGSGGSSSSSSSPSSPSGGSSASKSGE